MSTLDKALGVIVNQILDPVILLLFVVAFLVFIWGIFEMFYQSQNNTTAIETGKKHLLYGIIGMLIMVSFKAIMDLITGTIGHLG